MPSGVSVKMRARRSQPLRTAAKVYSSFQVRAVFSWIRSSSPRRSQSSRRSFGMTRMWMRSKLNRPWKRRLPSPHQPGTRSKLTDSPRTAWPTTYGPGAIWNSLLLRLTQSASSTVACAGVGHSPA